MSNYYLCDFIVFVIVVLKLEIQTLNRTLNNAKISALERIPFSINYHRARKVRAIDPQSHP